MSTGTYDPARVIVTFGGNILGGFADGTFVSAESAEDVFGLTKGAAGEGVFVKSNNDSGKVTFTVLASSQTNDLLAAIHAGDRLAGTGVGELMIKEANGTAYAHAREARIARAPKMERGKESANVEWEFLCADLEIFNGGLA